MERRGKGKYRWRSIEGDGRDAKFEERGGTVDVRYSLDTCLQRCWCGPGSRGYNCCKSTFWIRYAALAVKALEYRWNIALCRVGRGAFCRRWKRADGKKVGGRMERAKNRDRDLGSAGFKEKKMGTSPLLNSSMRRRSYGGCLSRRCLNRRIWVSESKN